MPEGNTANISSSHLPKIDWQLLIDTQEAVLCRDFSCHTHLSLIGTPNAFADHY